MRVAAVVGSLGGLIGGGLGGPLARRFRGRQQRVRGLLGGPQRHMLRALRAHTRAHRCNVAFTHQAHRHKQECTEKKTRPERARFKHACKRLLVRGARARPRRLFSRRVDFFRLVSNQFGVGGAERAQLGLRSGGRRQRAGVGLRERRSGRGALARVDAGFVREAGVASFARTQPACQVARLAPRRRELRLFTKKEDC